MFEHVLIAEDHESASISVRKTLEDLAVTDARYVYYCDDALLQLRHSIQENRAFQLLITDLSFEPDGREQKLEDGVALITAARILRPDLKVLVFSAESNPVTIDALFKNFQIDGFVRKARRDAEQMKIAIGRLAEGRNHYPPELNQVIRQQQAHDFQEIDLVIVRLLAQGVLQKDIPFYLSQKQIKPSSLSSVEKRLSLIKEHLGFNKNEQIVAFCKDARMI